MAENFINYQVALTPENATLIDKMNELMLGTKPPADDKTTSPKTTTAKETPAEEDTPKLLLKDMRQAVKTAKADHGEDFVNSVLDDNDIDNPGTLAKRVSAIDTGDYTKLIELLAAGPAETEDDGLGDDEDDGLGDDLDDEVDVESVKTALKAYAKSAGRDKAKELMAANGAKALSEVDKCDQTQLRAMLAGATA